MKKLFNKQYFFLFALTFFIWSNLFSQQTKETAVSYREKINNEIIVLKNNNSLIPLLNLDTLKIAYITFDNQDEDVLLASMQRYAKIDKIIISDFSLQKQNYNLVIIGIYKNYQYNTTKISNICKEHKTILCLFDKHDILRINKTSEYSSAIIYSFSNDSIAHDYCGQLIFGGIGTMAKLPVDLNHDYKKGDGIKIESIDRFKYTIPAEIGLDSSILYKKIDSIANYGIEQNGYPGCQIFIAKDMNVIFHKSYGYHTYDSIIPVKNTDLYDLASVTKISAPLPCLMKLNEENKFNLDAKLSEYWKPFKRSNKKNIIVRDVLCHQGQLEAWIPFYKHTKKKNKKYKRRTFKTDSSSRYNIKVADNLFLHKNYYKKVFKIIKKSELRDEKKYKYSDLSFYLYPTIIENITGEDYETYLKTNFYNKLGAYTLTYNPLDYFSKYEIVPTEDDKFFRKELIHGRVHDEGAILLGGVSGHAGLFGSSNDLAKLIQMYLNYGKYGSERYIQESTLKEWTSYQFEDNENRRGIGFDKVMLEKKGRGTPSIDVSEASFGHTGFTGTFVWADPENGLLIVFLSNRVYPTRENKNLWRKNIRTSIHQVLYDELEKIED